MFGYYFRLAVKSSGRSPGIAALIVFAMGLGIGVSVMMITIYHAMSSNPVARKDERLYAVTLDSWGADRPADPERPQLPPFQLTYTDATYLFNSNIPERKVLMYPVAAIVMPGHGKRPVKVHTRVTTADFFPMFDVPFSYGSGWNDQADKGSEPVTVLSHDLNRILFGGANSVGRTIQWNDHELRVVGVLAPWLPQPKFYDLNAGSFEEPEGAFVPWGWGKTLQMFSSGRIRCWTGNHDTYEQWIGSECTWVQMWLELPDADTRGRMQAFLDNYWAQQRKVGRFQRPRNNRLTRVSQWLEDNQVVSNDTRLLVGLAFAFLGVCLLNTVGLLLAKFLKEAPMVGIRRALGASRSHIFAQHIVQVGLLAFAGLLVALGFSASFLWGARVLYGGDPDVGKGGYQALAHFDAVSIAWSATLALLAVVIVGLYPAWRIGRVPPARYLKSQ